MAHKEGVAFFQDRQPHRGRIHKAMSKMLDLGGGASTFASTMWCTY